MREERWRGEETGKRGGGEGASISGVGPEPGWGESMQRNRRVETEERSFRTRAP